MNYPSPLLAEKLDRDALDKMLKMLDEKGRVVPLHWRRNPWYRYGNWKAWMFSKCFPLDVKKR